MVSSHVALAFSSPKLSGRVQGNSSASACRRAARRIPYLVNAFFGSEGLRRTSYGGLGGAGGGVDFAGVSFSLPRLPIKSVKEKRTETLKRLSHTVA